MTRIKICGLTNRQDALFAAQAGADLLGFIFAPVSKRYITPEAGQQIIAEIKASLGENAPICVGVFVTQASTPAMIAAQCVVAGVDAAQIVGLDSVAWLDVDVPAYACIRPETTEIATTQATLFEQLDLPEFLPSLQVDTFHPTLYGGTGETASEDVAKALSQRTRRFMLAGGLTPENVGHYVESVRPWAVDVASGTEASPGKKDLQKVRDFIEAVKQTDKTS